MLAKIVQFSPEQFEELLNLARHGKEAHVRLKARAVYAVVGKGMSCEIAARALGMERRSVGRWVREYEARGASAFGIREGRGRKAQVDAVEIVEYLRQSPRQFGIPLTRWTLVALRNVVPCLKGMTESGVWRALKRLGYRYKRGQPVVHSPDPEYREKRGLWSRPLKK